MVIQAVFEQGVFRPLGPVPNLQDSTQVVLEIRKKVPNKKRLMELKGSISARDAAIMQSVIKEGRRIEGNW